VFPFFFLTDHENRGFCVRGVLEGERKRATLARGLGMLVLHVAGGGGSRHELAHVVRVSRVACCGDVREVGEVRWGSAALCVGAGAVVVTAASDRVRVVVLIRPSIALCVLPVVGSGGVLTIGILPSGVGPAISVGAVLVRAAVLLHLLGHTAFRRGRWQPAGRLASRHDRCRSRRDGLGRRGPLCHRRATLRARGEVRVVAGVIARAATARRRLLAALWRDARVLRARLQQLRVLHGERAAPARLAGAVVWVGVLHQLSRNGLKDLAQLKVEARVDGRFHAGAVVQQLEDLDLERLEVVLGDPGEDRGERRGAQRSVVPDFLREDNGAEPHAAPIVHRQDALGVHHALNINKRDDVALCGVFGTLVKPGDKPKKQKSK